MNKFWSIVLIFGLFSCENSKTQEEIDNKANLELEIEAEDTIAVDSDIPMEFMDEIAFAEFCAEQLKNGDVDNLKTFTKGKILLSPYARIDKATARKVSLEEIASDSTAIHLWGIQDGSGNPIKMTTSAYIKKYVLSFDLGDEKVERKIFIDQLKKRGNQVQNIHDFYPNASYVEFYYPPSKEGNLDWKAVIYVVEKVDFKYVLKAIIHNQWTV